jgi:hypothetical protein
MTQYLLSTYIVDGEVPDGPPTPDEMQAMMGQIVALEAEMESSGTFVFAGRLHGPDAATVVHNSGAGVVVTDGPFAEAKEHIAGFYIIDAEDLDAALAWAGRVSECINRPIEVYPFAATGRAADQMHQMPGH